MRFPSLIPCSLALLAACTAPPRYGLLEGEPDADRLQQQVRAGTNEASLSLTNQVAAVSADILLRNEDPGARRAALVFWSRVGDEAGRALYHQDPVAAATDLTAFVLQLQDWLAEGGDGAAAFGSDQERVRAMIDGFAEELVTVIEESEASVVRGEALPRAREWADLHPLKGPHLVRVSMAPLMGRLGSSQGRSVFGMADSVESSVSSIETRLEVLGHRLPAQLVTQAVFLVDAYVERIGIEELIAEARLALEQVGDLDAVLKRERTATLVEVDRQREATLDRVQALEQSLEQHVSAERAALVEHVEVMRAQTLADLERQRKETLTRLEALTASTVADLDRQGQALADRLDGALERSLGRRLEGLQTSTLELDGPLGREAAEDVLRGARELVDVVFLRALAIVGLLGVCLIAAAGLLRRRST